MKDLKTIFCTIRLNAYVFDMGESKILLIVCNFVKVNLRLVKLRNWFIQSVESLKISFHKILVKL